MIEPIDLGITGLTNIERIGAGGNAIVYRALQSDLDRNVVVKVLTNLDAETTGRRFDRERRAMGRLSQANGIAPLYGTGFTSNGQPYLLMPFYELGSLQNWLETRGALPPEQVRTIGITIARAVQTAHENSVLHRDLKPANILMSRSGQPDVADFGIAHLVDDALGTSQALTMTPLYTAPEAFDGIESGAAGDIYSLGATLYALLNGRPAYGDSSGSTSVLSLMRRINEDPWPALGAAVPDALSSVVERAMSKDPAARYGTAAELADALSAVEIQGARAQSPAQRTKLSGMAVGAIAVLLAAVVGVLVAYSLLRDSDGPVAQGDLVTTPTPVETTSEPTTSEPTTEAIDDVIAPRLTEFDLAAATAAGEGVVVRVEAYSCVGAEVAHGVLLNDGIVVTSSSILESPWYIDVWYQGEVLRAEASSVDHALGLGLVVLEDATTVDVLPGVVVGAGDTVGLVGLDGRPAEARITSSGDSSILQAAVVNPRSGNAIETGDAAVTDTGGLVGVVRVTPGEVEVLTPQQIEVEWSPSEPDFACDELGGDLNPGDAEFAVSPAIRELLTMQRLSDAYANEEWDIVVELEPEKLPLTTQDFIAGWRPLRQGFIYPVNRTVDTDGVAQWVIALIGHETWAGTDITTLFCVNWTVDPVSGRVSQGDRDTVTMVYGSQPSQPQRNGFVDPADLRDEISQNC